jgi:hypothetical protein
MLPAVKQAALLRSAVRDEARRRGLPEDLGLGPTIIDAGFADDVAFRDNVFAAALGASGVETTNRVYETHFWVRWCGFGFPVFRLTHSLAAAFALTDVSSLSWSDVKLPFPTLQIRLPVPNGFVRLDDKRDGEANSILVHTLRAPTDPTSENGVLSWSEIIDARQRLLEEGIDTHNITVNWQKGTYGLLRIHRAYDFAQMWREMAERPWRQAALRIVMNLCLYLASLGSKDSWPQKNKLRGFRSAKKKHAEVTVWELGKEIKLGAEVLDAARTQTGSRKGWKLAKKYMVRGHWRNQACGRNLQDRKLRWIEPYWKGPENAKAALARLYTTET